MAVNIQKNTEKRGSGMEHEISETLKKVKGYLQRGDLKQIAEDQKVSEQTIASVMSGKRKNWKLVNAIIEKAQANKSILEKAQAI